MCAATTKKIGLAAVVAATVCAWAVPTAAQEALCYAVYAAALWMCVALIART